MSNTILKIVCLLSIGAPPLAGHVRLTAAIDMSMFARAVGTLAAQCLVNEFNIDEAVAPAECKTAYENLGYAATGCLETALSDDEADGYVNTCPGTCQADIDTIYSACEECPDWETAMKTQMKAIATATGCGGAAHTAPALFAAAFAVLGQFLS